MGNQVKKLLNNIILLLNKPSKNQNRNVYKLNVICLAIEGKAVLLKGGHIFERDKEEANQDVTA